MGIDITAATIADLPELLILVQSAYRGASARGGWTHEADLLDGQRTDAESLEAMLADPRQRLLLARDDDMLVGCVAVEHKGDGAYFGMLSVMPERQASGLGRTLIAAAEALARNEFGATWMEITVIAQRAELIAWYERRGYTLTGERRPFPVDERFGLPKANDLAFVVLAKRL
jgi:ribosomal protein S18 acetylase RimI-like enzyme